ncbi:MAG TPA: hypothetical protein VFS42_04330 [Burkholderiaceae bacterium]|nr:hypothetical protein [Burkholderiaceae bacterium]
MTEAQVGAGAGAGAGVIDEVVALVPVVLVPVVLVPVVLVPVVFVPVVVSPPGEAAGAGVGLLSLTPDIKGAA